MIDREEHRKRSLDGIRRAIERGRLPGSPARVSDDQIREAMHLGTAEGSRRVGLSKRQFIERRRRLEDAETMPSR